MVVTPPARLKYLRLLHARFAKMTLFGLLLLGAIHPLNGMPARLSQLNSVHPLVVPARVVCEERYKTTYKITYFCDDGYTCDMTDRKCDPGPEILARTKELLWSGGRGDCDSASELERGTAAWYDTCVIDNDMKSSSDYTPSIAPEKLAARAKENCKSAAPSALGDCLTNTKVQILMAESPDVRSGCATQSGADLIDCVDLRYVYGPNEEAMLRHMKTVLSHAQPGEPRDAGNSTPAAPLPHSKGCLAGHGMKPTPGGFGSWSCQPLGVIFLSTDRSKANPIQSFENRVIAIATTMAAAAADAGEEKLSTEDRAKCIAMASEAVREVFKGGSSPVPEVCRPMVGAARDELIRYARAHIGSLEPGTEELMSALRSLTRQAIQERQEDCLHHKFAADKLSKCLLDAETPQ